MNLKDLKLYLLDVQEIAQIFAYNFDNIRYYSSLFGESCSNLRMDQLMTKDILNKNQKKKWQFFILCVINKLPNQGQRLENARNLIIETIKNDINLNSCDLFIILDLDDIGAYRIANKDIQIQ